MSERLPKTTQLARIEAAWKGPGFRSGCASILLTAAFFLVPSPARAQIAQIIDSMGDGMAQLDGPTNIATDRSGNAFVSGAGSSNVFRITPGGTVIEIINALGDGMNGQKLVTGRLQPFTGVVFASLQSLSGDADFRQSGRLDFNLGAFASSGDSYFGTSSQSLGTFAGGQRLVPGNAP